MSNYDEHGNWHAPRDRRPLPLYPHHCAPEDVAALVRRLEALSDPEQEAVPSYENTDWRTLAGVAARVIKYLNGADWRAGA
jgi:hypothetical protein